LVQSLAVASQGEVPVDQEKLIAMAAAVGLTRLRAKHLEQLQASTVAAGELASKLPKDLAWTEELALTFRLPRPADDKP
jgi:hypothetical protein